MSSQVNIPAPPPSTDAGPSAPAALEEIAFNLPPSPPALVHGTKRHLDLNDWNFKGGKAARTKLRDNPAPLKLARKRRLSHFRTMQRKEVLSQAGLATGIPGQDAEAVMQESTTPAGSPRVLGMVLDADVTDENSDMGSDMDEEEVDAIVDEYMAGDEDEGDGRMSLEHHLVSQPSQLQPAAPVAPQPVSSQQETCSGERPASYGITEHVRRSHPPVPYQAASPHTHPPPPPIPYAGQQAPGIPASYDQHRVPVPYAPQQAMGVPVPYAPQQAVGVHGQYLEQQAMGVHGQYLEQQAMGVPVQYAQQRVMGVHDQYLQQQAMGVPTEQQVMSGPSQYAVPGQHHPQHQAYAPIHPFQVPQSASYGSSFASGPYPSSGNQQAGHTLTQLAKPVVPQNARVAAPAHQVRSRTVPPDDSQPSASAKLGQQSFLFINVDPTQPSSQRRRLTSTNSLASLPETSTSGVVALPTVAASTSHHKPPSRAPSSKNLGKECSYAPSMNQQRYEPPRDPPAYEPPPQQPRATDDAPPGNRDVAGRRPSASPTPGPSRDVHQQIVDKLSLLDEADRQRVMAALYPEERTTEMDVDDDNALSKTKGKSRADKLPALAMVLDKVQRVEDVCRDNANRSKKFEARVQDTLTQVQHEMAEIKNVNPPARKHALQARRAVKPPRAPRQSRMMQIEEHLPPNFNTMDVGDQQLWLRKQKDELDLLACHVRVHLKKVVGFQTWEELVKKNPPLTGDQVKLFANPKTSVLDVFSDRRLHFDFEQSWEKFSFNREASKLFVTDFLSKVKAGQYSNPPVDPRYLTAHNVAIALSVYMGTCRRKYREVLDPVSADEKERRADSSCKNGRRNTLLRQRMLTTERRGWDQFDPLWQALTPANMSDDETDSGSKKGKEKATRRRKHHWPTWTVIRSRWQSDALVEFLHGVDKHYRRDWENPGRYSGKRKSSGQPPRRRYLKETSKVEEGVVPRGLWRNCYNAAWLKTLRPDEIAALQIINKDFNLKLPTAARDTSDEESDGEDTQSAEDEEMQ